MKAVQATAVVLTGAMALAGCAGQATAPGTTAVIQTTAMECGQLDILLLPRDDGLLLRVGEEDYLLAQTRSASGARYALPVDPSTWFWRKGERALLETGGRRWPECVPAGGLTEPFVARGNEPFWQLTVADDKLLLEAPGGRQIVADASVVSATSTGQTLAGDNTEHELEVAVARQLCRDSMTGMPHPYQVRLRVDAERFSGCGGEPARLLQGVEWAVTAIDGEPVADGTRASLNFLDQGRAAGKASCNRFMGEYQLSGEALGFSRMATTMMACAPEVMAQEQRFLTILETVQRFDFSASGALVLTGTDGRTLVAESHQTLGR
ncbi:META domain-containing protein [Marinobacter sp. SS21]|uniref:META domain-containing protein n=1 Tax=Marinobacter sp. SS21 TaxID=2979460 RepID=UPI00232F1F13|nr:META domain-containing protein [Marinobacter sp. SS21]MDC0662304.1 META domain-containing protein [Marinobacter sp. SS21]